ncbi:hypothetical protein GBAR_LOCUS8759 [Geodia barretti]|uniref:Uncharacterized protein n=1 Tax=Geodia barretti TaxID=519541 RepID=A0AA35WE35_GEOBA|nr:hypothetical protein GBAR_LOCUS8759 [Geodia barretti]
MSRQSRPWQVFSKHSKLCVQSTTRPLYRYKCPRDFAVNWKTQFWKFPQRTHSLPFLSGGC